MLLFPLFLSSLLPLFFLIHLIFSSTHFPSFPLYNIHTIFVSLFLFCSLSLPLSTAIPNCFPKGFTLKLRENIQAWNSPERVLNTHLLFHFQDETRALILKNPVCPDGLLRQRGFHPSLAVSSFLCIHLLALFYTNSLSQSLTQNYLLLFHL